MRHVYIENKNAYFLEHLYIFLNSNFSFNIKYIKIFPNYLYFYKVNLNDKVHDT